MLTFEPFRVWCVRNRKGRKDVIKECGIGLSTTQKIWHDETPFRSDILEKLCATYSLKVDEVIEFRIDPDQNE